MESCRDRCPGTVMVLAAVVSSVQSEEGVGEIGAGGDVCSRGHVLRGKVRELTSVVWLWFVELGIPPSPPMPQSYRLLRSEAFHGGRATVTANTKAAEQPGKAIKMLNRGREGLALVPQPKLYHFCAFCCYVWGSADDIQREPGRMRGGKGRLLRRKTSWRLRVVSSVLQVNWTELGGLALTVLYLLVSLAMLSPVQMSTSAPPLPSPPCPPPPSMRCHNTNQPNPPRHTRHTRYP